MIRLAAISVTLVVTLCPPHLSAQVVSQDTSLGRTVRLVPGSHYSAGWLHRWILGDHYRDLWTDSVSVPLLDLNRFAGGLTVLCRGGGFQTKSLRFQGADGDQYVFRSVDKDPSYKLPPELRKTFVADVLQDQISSHHPAGAVVVAPLLDAAGVLHATPRLAIMPDAEALGAYRPSFGGVLGLVEERPRDGPAGTAGFGGSRRIESSEYVWDKIESDPDHRVDPRAFLRARLMDVFIGDWDRHYDQWRWARYPDGEGYTWRPIPRDRDQAFSQLDGVILSMARHYVKELVNFDESFGSIYGLTWTGRALDRRFLPALEKPAWDSIVADLQQRLSDRVIEDAVRSMPPEYFRPNGPKLINALQRRRDDLQSAADRYYDILANRVDVHGTDEDETVEVERIQDVGIHVAIRHSENHTIFERTFQNDETDQVRLYVHGGDDRVVIRGTAAYNILIHVIGGGGDDTFVDSSTVDTGRAARFYDARGDVDDVEGRRGSVDERRFRPPEVPFPIRERPEGACGDSVPEIPPQDLFFPFRDWGHDWLPSPWTSIQPDIGLFVGVGAVRFGYGFRKVPYSSYSTIQFGYATAPRRFRFQYAGDFRRAAGDLGVLLNVRYSGIDIVRFHGFGNETSLTGTDEFYKMTLRQVQVAPSLTVDGPGAARLAAGFRFRYGRTILGTGNFIDQTQPYGSEPFAQIGLGADFSIDTRDLPAVPTRGVHVLVSGTLVPSLLDVTSTFASVSGEASTYLSAPGMITEPTLAFRAGGKKVFGPYPYHEAAYLGGSNTVRGYNEHRFAGDAAVYGNAELRLYLLRYKVILPGDFGVFGLADVGRVFVEGESSDQWHHGVGGGIWLAFVDRASTVSLAIAQSPEKRLMYARLGFMF
jgi:hypothetical protein